MTRRKFANRRKFIGAAATAVVGALAGCSSATGQLPPPQISEAKLKNGGWETVSDSTETVFEETYLGVEVNADARTVVYEDVALRSEVTEKTLDSVDARLGTFFASRISFSPNLNSLPGGAGSDTIRTEAKGNAETKFKGQLERSGVTNISKTGETTITVETGKRVPITKYDGEYRVESMEFPIKGGETVSIEGQSLTVNAFLGAWNRGDYTFVAGGAYPGENFTDYVETRLSNAITVTVDIDLGLTPGAYRDEQYGLLKSVR